MHELRQGSFGQRGTSQLAAHIRIARQWTPAPSVSPANYAMRVVHWEQHVSSFELAMRIAEHAGVPGETLTAIALKGFIERDAGGRVDLTDCGRAALRRTLPDL